MARLYLLGGIKEFGWKVTGITSTTETIAIFNTSFTSGGTSQPSGLIDYETNFPMDDYIWVTNVSSGTKTVHFGGKNETSKKWYYYGSETVTVEDKEETIKLDAPSFDYSPGRTSCTITWTRPSGASRLYYKVWAHGGSEPDSYTWVDAYKETEDITGLKSDTTYKIQAYYYTNTPGYEDSDKMFEGSAFTTKSSPTFAWSTTPQSGKQFSVTKEDWDSLQNVINQRREFNRSWIHTSSRGQPLTADMWNEVIAILNSCSGLTEIPSRVKVGDTCYASMFNDLAKCVNKI